MLPYLLQGLALGFPAAATPGPLQALLLNLTVRNGWRRTLPAALAPLISDGPIVLLVVFLLERTPSALLDVLRLAGGLFLLLLAANALRNVGSTKGKPVTADAVGARSLMQAAAANLLNPNPYIFWSLVAGPLLIEAWRQAPAAGISFLIGFYGTIVAGFALLILLFAYLGGLHRRARQSLTYISAIALFAFGLYLLWSGATALLV